MEKRCSHTTNNEALNNILLIKGLKEIPLLILIKMSECCICYNLLDETIMVTLKCKHNLCLECLHKLKEQKCPLCRGCCQFDKCNKNDKSKDRLYEEIANLKQALWDNGYDFCESCGIWKCDEDIRSCQNGCDMYSCVDCIEQGEQGYFHIPESTLLWCTKCDNYFCNNCFGYNGYCEDCDKMEVILKIASNTIFKQYLAKMRVLIKPRAEHRKQMKIINKSIEPTNMRYGFCRFLKNYTADLEDHYAKMRTTLHFIRFKAKKCE